MQVIRRAIAWIKTMIAGAWTGVPAGLSSAREYAAAAVASLSFGWVPALVAVGAFVGVACTGDGMKRDACADVL